MINKIIQFILKRIYSIKGFFKYIKLKKGETYFNKLYNCPCVFEGKHKFRLLKQTVEPTTGVGYVDYTRTTAIRKYVDIYLFLEK